MELARLSRRSALLRDRRGQASVELLATVPAVLLVAALVWELALAGQTAWLSAQAARAGARARVVGRDPRAAARSVLPESLRGGLRVEEASGGAVRVRLTVPLLLRAWKGPIAIGATARLGDDGG
jgi:hypothetical protein